MSNPTAICSTTACDSLAAHECDNCGRPYCEDHLQPLLLTRRVEPDARRSWDLARVPSISKSYLLCVHCRRKPYAGRPIVQPDTW
jgi:hypothetical protein